MKRMTTDNPQLNIERLLNTARAENNQAVLHLGDEVITLAEYVSKYAKETGCDVTPESVMDGDNCIECDCPVAILNVLGIQAAENNARLKIIEKILGDDYDLNRLKELVEADREGRCVVLPCKVGDSMWVHDKDGKPREMKLGSPDIRCYCKEEDNFCMTLCAEKRTGVCAYRLHNDGKDIGKTVFRTREAAESALKAMKERK